MPTTSRLWSSPCIALLAGLGLFVPGAASAQPTLELTFDGPSTVAATPQSTVQIEVTGQLVTSNNAGGQGATGWSIGWSASGARVVDPTARHTLAALDTDDPPGLRDSESSFEITELAIDSDPVRALHGAISSVVLNFVDPLALPDEGIADIVKFKLEGTVPSAGETETWTAFYVDGLVIPGTPPPQNNSVLMGDNQFYAPSLGAYEVQVTGVPEPAGIRLLIAGLGVGLMGASICAPRRATS